MASCAYFRRRLDCSWEGGATRLELGGVSAAVVEAVLSFVASGSAAGLSRVWRWRSHSRRPDHSGGREAKHGALGRHGAVYSRVWDIKEYKGNIRGYTNNI